MFYIAAFILGGFARTLPKLLLFAAMFMALYSAFFFAIEWQQLKEGRTSVPYLAGYLAVEWAVGFSVCGLGYLCRLVVVGQRPPPDAERREQVETTFD